MQPFCASILMVILKQVRLDCQSQEATQHFLAAFMEDGLENKAGAVTHKKINAISVNIKTRENS